MRISQILLFSCMVMALGACGVKGKPQPPLYAPPIGRGKPTLNSNQKFLKLSPLVAPSEPEKKQ